MCNILLVEEDHESRRTLAGVLVEAGYTVFSSGTMFEAVKVIGAQGIDIAIIDFSLPDGDGIDIVRRFSERLRCIIMTGPTGRELRNEATLKGVYAFLDKPFTEEELITVVDRVAVNLLGRLPSPINGTHNGDNTREVGDKVDLQTIYSKLSSVSSRVRTLIEDADRSRQRIIALEDDIKEVKIVAFRLEAVDERTKDCSARGSELAILKEQVRGHSVNWDRIISILLTLVQLGLIAYVTNMVSALAQ